MEQIAKLFANGRSQAVRLPASFRFDAKEVYVRLDDETKDVILSRRPASWDGFLVALSATNTAPDFLSPEERAAGHAQASPERDPLDGIGA